MLPARCKAAIKASIKSIHPLLTTAMCPWIICRDVPWIANKERTKSCFLNVPRFNLNLVAFEDGIVCIDPS